MFRLSFQTPTLISHRPELVLSPGNFLAQSNVRQSLCFHLYVTDECPLATLTNGTVVTLPLQMSTYNEYDTFSFLLNQTIAFYVRGALNWDHGTFLVTLTSPPNVSAIKQQLLNGSSRWADWDDILYFETGLDPSKTYQVQFENVGNPPLSAFDVGALVLTQVTGFVPYSPPHPTLIIVAELPLGHRR